MEILRTDRMFFSIIIPIFNCDRYLKSAVESVLNQPVDDLEIILVDDGSTDKSGEICDYYASTYDNISVVHQENQGVSAARNRGLACAQGNYILFLDADDCFVGSMINQNMMAECEKGYDVLLYSSLISDVERRRYGIDMLMKDTLIAGKQALPISGHFASGVYKRELLLENHVSFDEGIRLNEDEVFKMKAMYAAQTIRSSSSFLYIYNTTPGSAKYTEKHIFDFVKAWEKAQEWLEEFGHDGNIAQAYAFVKQKILSRLLLYAKLYIQQGHNKEELLGELQSHEEFSTLMNLPIEYMIPNQRDELTLFQKNIDGFIRLAQKEKYKIMLGRILLKNPIIRHWRDKKRMPWTSIDDVKTLH